MEPDSTNLHQPGSGSQFDCHICLCTASDPVVTLCAFILPCTRTLRLLPAILLTADCCRCGHLYCWGCLYTWLCRQKSCPTCKDYCDEVWALSSRMPCSVQSPRHGVTALDDASCHVFCLTVSSRLIGSSTPYQHVILQQYVGVDGFRLRILHAELACRHCKELCRIE